MTESISESCAILKGGVLFDFKDTALVDNFLDAKELRSRLIPLHELLCAFKVRLMAWSMIFNSLRFLLIPSYSAYCYDLHWRRELILVGILTLRTLEGGGFDSFSWLLLWLKTCVYCLKVTFFSANGVFRVLLKLFFRFWLYLLLDGSVIEQRADCTLRWLWLF